MPENAQRLNVGVERVHDCDESHDAIAHRQDDFADSVAAEAPRSYAKRPCTDDEFVCVDDVFARSGEDLECVSETFACVGEEFGGAGEEFGGAGEEFEPSGEEFQAVREWFSSRALATTPSTKITRRNDKWQRRSHLKRMHAALGRALSTQ